MAFVSVEFLAFISVVCLVYFLTPARAKWIVLLMASYVFYAFSSIKMLVFLLFTTATTFVAGQLLGKVSKRTKEYIASNKESLGREEKKAYKERQLKKKRRIVFLMVFINLGMLIFLKYFNFLAGNVNQLLGITGVDVTIPFLELFLPLGISFYTLQAIGYVVDVYREKYEPDKNIVKFALFMSFFPQIVQGPIARYDHLAHQLYEPHKFDYDRVTKGAQLILWGFMKKLVLADRIAILVNQIFNNYTQYEGVMLFIGAVGYSLQIYGDFSGGMDIARGVSQILGIDLAVNFERPYFSRSLGEFWRRWHITLGSWMKDYVFYPLSLSKSFNKLGKRCRKIFGNYIGKKLPTFLSMFIVFMFVGVWHGSSWKYIAYGFWNGGIISASILLESFYEKCNAACKIDAESYGWKFIQMVRTFVLCSLGRYFSRAETCRIALSMFKGTFICFNPWVLTDGTLMQLGLEMVDYLLIATMILILLVVGILQERGVHLRDSIAQQNIIFRWTLYMGALIFVLLAGIYGPGYSASEFIYQQF